MLKSPIIKHFLPSALMFSNISLMYSEKLSHEALGGLYTTPIKTLLQCVLTSSMKNDSISELLTDKSLRLL